MTPEERQQFDEIKQHVEFLSAFMRQFVGSDRYVIQKNILEFEDGRNIQTGVTNGTKIGGATNQKLSVYGVTPVIQRASADQAAVATTGATQTTPWGYTTAAQADAIVTLLNEIRQTLVNFGVMKGSA